MTSTPLQEIEAAAHDEFGEVRPTDEQIAELLTKRFPKMEGGIAIAIALAALILQGWQVYRDEQDRRRQAAMGGGSKCPICGQSSIKTNATGKSVCENNHTW